MPKLQEQLEGLIDKHGIKAILQASATICFIKSSYVLEEWQDAPASKSWKSIGRSIDNLIWTIHKKRYLVF